MRDLEVNLAHHQFVWCARLPHADSRNQPVISRVILVIPNDSRKTHSIFRKLWWKYVKTQKILCSKFILQFVQELLFVYTNQTSSEKSLTSRVTTNNLVSNARGISEEITEVSVKQRFLLIYEDTEESCSIRKSHSCSEIIRFSENHNHVRRFRYTLAAVYQA